MRIKQKTLKVGVQTPSLFSSKLLHISFSDIIQMYPQRRTDGTTDKGARVPHFSNPMATFKSRVKAEKLNRLLKDLESIPFRIIVTAQELPLIHISYQIPTPQRVITTTTTTSTKTLMMTATTRRRPGDKRNENDDDENRERSMQ